MKRIVGFVRHHKDSTPEQRTSAIQMIAKHAERTGASVAQVFEVPPGAASGAARQVFQQALVFVRDPAHSISALLLPSTRDLPRALQELADLEHARMESQVDLAVLDLPIGTSAEASLETYTKIGFTAELVPRIQSKRIKVGMRRASKRRGGEA